jgi:hypothetical protein
VNADGTLDLTSEGFSTKAASLVEAAHNHNVSVLVGLVQYVPTNFHQAISGHLVSFVSNIGCVADSVGRICEKTRAPG